MTTCVDHDDVTRVFTRIVKPWGRADPYGDYAILRTHAPVLRSSLPTLLGGYVLSSYADCSAVLRGRAFASMDPQWMDIAQPDWRSSQTSHLAHHGIGFQNAPEHARLRRTIAPHFTPRRISLLRELISGFVEELLDSVAAAARQGGTVDFVESIARPLPVRVMQALFGVDAASANKLARLGHAAATVLDPIRSPTQHRQMENATAEMIDTFGELVRQRAAEPDDSLLSAVIEACGGDPADPGLLGNLIYLYTAGHETLVGFLALAMHALLENPVQAEILRSDPAMAEPAVEELLRFDAPIQVLVRVVTEPVRLGDDIADPGTPVLALLGSANRDPAHTPDPDRLDFTRTAAKPLSFGTGPHYCIGAFLARMEAQLLLPRLLQRFPALRSAGRPTFRSPGVALRGIEQLPVRV